MTAAVQVAIVGHRLGPADAAATIVVYGTYECLHCRRAWPTLRALAGEGRLAVEWRHFAPPGAFPNAPVAATAAEAAAAQGAFWRMHEALLVAPTPLWPESVGAIARMLGLDMARFESDLEAPETRARLEALAARAAADGVHGTPSVRVEVAGEPVSGWLDTWDVDALRAAALALAAAHGR